MIFALSESVQCADLARTLYERSVSTKCDLQSSLWFRAIQTIQNLMRGATHSEATRSHQGVPILSAIIRVPLRARTRDKQKSGQLLPGKTRATIKRADLVLGSPRQRNATILIVGKPRMPTVIGKAVADESTYGEWSGAAITKAARQAIYRRLTS